MDTMYELTEAECEAVGGGSDGQNVAIRNHITGSGPGHNLGAAIRSMPGIPTTTGKLVSALVHGTVDIPPLPSPNAIWGFGLHFG
jgi:hypothetical protein